MTSRLRGIVRMSQAVFRAFGQMDKASDRATKAEAKMPAPGNRVMRALHEGTVSVLGGGTEEARRSLLLAVTAELALGEKGVLLFPLVMPGLDAVRRILAAGSGVAISTVRTARGMTQSELGRLITAADNARKLNLHIDDPHQLTPVRLTRRVKWLATFSPVGTVVIDDLDRVQTKVGGRRSSRLATLGLLAHELRIAILVGSKRIPPWAPAGTPAKRRRLSVTVRPETARAVPLTLAMFGAAPSPPRWPCVE
ncbi:MAG: hypothetical protein HY905_06905 [Deltaproteobacteria bacterium]|nr:hypothetical protein [Deltaproteobacteria bacterium]